MIQYNKESVTVPNRPVSQINNARGNISNSLIKKAQLYLIKPLTLIIKQCLRTGVFPHQLKLSKVRPTFKCKHSKSCTSTSTQ